MKITTAEAPPCQSSKLEITDDCNEGNGKFWFSLKILNTVWDKKICFINKICIPLIYLYILYCICIYKKKRKDNSDLYEKYWSFRKKIILP